MGLEKQLSLEKQLRGAYDLAREILAHIETARDSLAEDNTRRVAWEIGCATGGSHRSEYAPRSATPHTALHAGLGSELQSSSHCIVSDSLG